MKEHKNLYYIFLWDYEKNKVSFKKIELIKKAFIENYQIVKPKQHSPPIINEEK